MNITIKNTNIYIYIGLDMGKQQKTLYKQQINKYTQREKHKKQNISLN